MYKLLIKQIVIIVLIILIIFSIIFGAILPWKKSKLYIDALLDMQSGRTYTAEQFETQMGHVLDFYSFIGQEEAVKFFSADILNVINQNNYPEQTLRFLIGYIDNYLFKENPRHLIVGGSFYRILWHSSGKEEDYKKSEEYFKKAYSIGPKLPPVLYNLFDLYKFRGDKENMKKIGEEILKYWPDDENVANLLSNL